VFITTLWLCPLWLGCENLLVTHDASHPLIGPASESPRQPGTCSQWEMLRQLAG